jgi:selenocysteine-specific translation elongation factor
MKDAECVIYLVDASAIERFKEARQELWKLMSIIKNTPLIVLANKYDLQNKQPVASLGQIIEALELNKMSSFEIIPISCKTGCGIVNAFSKIYYKLTGKSLSKKLSPKALTIFNNGGVPLTTAQREDLNQNVLRGGLFAAITSFVKESFNSELNQLKLNEHLIIFHKTEHLMGSIVLNDSDQIDAREAELGLRELLVHLENMCPEVQETDPDPERIEYLVQQFATNIFD